MLGLAPLARWSLALALVLSPACSSPPQDPPAPVGQGPELDPALVAQSALLTRRMLEPVPGVHVAVGYGLANVILLVGPTGVVVVDTTEGRGPATEVLAELRRITDLPIAAIVLTHNHADHVFGGQVFVEAAPPGVPVWAHERTAAEIDRVVHVLRDAIQVRSQRMFGSFLPEDRGVGDGIGHRLRYAPGDIALARPTHTFSDRALVQAGGLRLELLHAPGETDDQLAVWLPERRILLPADNVYQAFPNLYTIRGTSNRDTRTWVESLDRMRDLEADVLVPQHTLPVVGQAEVEAVLTPYRDAIQYVHDQAVRGMNAGRSPDQLAAEIALPPHLAGHPWLAEHYGAVPWSVRGIYAGYLGWFDGRGAGLEPLPPDERARRYAAAFEAGLPLAAQARQALDRGEAVWAAELAQLLVEAEPEDPAGRLLLAEALEARARGHHNANARNWYLTEALELRGHLALAPTPPDAAPVAFIDQLPVDAFMQGLPTRLRAEDCLDVDWRAVFHFTDEAAWYLVHIRHGVAEVRRRPEDVLAEAPADLRVITTARTWKRIASGHQGAARALATGELQVEGGLTELLRLQGWLETQATAGGPGR